MIRRASSVLILLALLAGAAPGRATDLTGIKAAGVLRVLAGQGEQPEMFSFEATEEPGFERELVEGFARLNKVKIEIHAVKRWEDRIPQLLKNEGEPVSAGWGLRKEDKDLRAALDEYLANVRKSATWSRLVVKYFGAQALKALGK